MARNGRRLAPVWVTLLLVIIGVVLAVIAVVYFSRTAGHLPSFFPGHQFGSTHHHTKHGIAAAVVALIAFVLAWMSSGRRRTA
jgi:NADH:ubiquinone oxidoreductase subunit 2 (subunit N)